MRSSSATAAGWMGSLLLFMGTCLTGEQLWMEAKAWVADQLIGRALAAHLVDGNPHRPWRWADMHPIAELAVPRLQVHRNVLSGASGESMAFGLGHLDGTDEPNGSGNCVIAGHRDAAAGFLQHLTVGDELWLQTHSAMRRYRVEQTVVVSMQDAMPIEMTCEPRLTLLTCYPFGAWRGSTLRFVVVCAPVSGEEPLRGS